MQWFGLISLFPDMFSALTEHGITGRAVRQGLVAINTWNPRDFTDDKHRTVDDRPYGGGPGMLMKAQPLHRAIHAAKKSAPCSPKVICLSPQGRILTDQTVQELAQHPALVLVSGRYEGIDERLLNQEIDEEWSVGDFVLSGGELPAMLMMDAIIRTLPGALGDQESLEQDSFRNGLLDHPHYTRPECFMGQKVPSVLLSGNHQAIQEWRLKQSLGRTWQRRPDLFKKMELSDKQYQLLDAYKTEQSLC